MVLFLLLLQFGETLTGVYVNNDVADEGPLTELSPAPIANAITALHWIFWDAPPQRWRCTCSRYSFIGWSRDRTCCSRW